MLWRGGCIIRRLLQNIKEAYETNTDLPNLLLDPYFKEIVESYQGGLRQIISMAVQQGIPIPAFSAQFLIMTAIVLQNYLQTCYKRARLF